MLRSASTMLSGSGRVVATLAFAAALSPVIALACDRESVQATAAACCSKATHSACVTRASSASVTKSASSSGRATPAVARKHADPATFRSFAVPQNAGETAGSVLALPSLAPGAAGMRIQLDPENGLGQGDVLPTQIVERAFGQPSLDFSSEGLVPVTLPDGSVMVDLKGRFREYSVVRLDAAGKPHIVCVPGRDQAKKVVSQPLPPDAAPASAAE